MLSLINDDLATHLNNTQQANPLMFSYKNYILSSAFQPIISIAHRRAVGYEGLIRARTDEGAITMLLT